MRFNGDMDEVRISSVARSADWIWACWMNTASNDQFAAYGTVAVTVPSNITVAVLGAQSVSSDSGTLRGEIRSTGDAENPDTYFCWGSSDVGTATTGSWPWAPSRPRLTSP